MNDSHVLVRLVGIVPLEDYRKAITHFAGLVGALTSEIAGKDAITWQVSNLEYGSATIEIVGFADNPDSVRQVVEAYRVVGEAAAKDHPIPYSPLVRTQLEALTQLINGHIKSIEFRTQSGLQVVEKPIVPRLVQPPTKWSAIGSIQGEVETLSKRAGLYFVLYDRLFNRAVRCYMAEGQEDMMRGIWGRVVLVTGEVTREPKTGRPLEVRNIVDIQLIDMVPANSHRHLRGIIAHNPDALPTHERVQRLRDED